MKLWLLRPILFKPNDPWEPWYDKVFGFVIRAHTEGEARTIADRNAGDENGSILVDSKAPLHPWLDPEFSTCVVLEKQGETELIMRDFAAA